MKYSLKFTPQTLDTASKAVSQAQLKFAAWLIDSCCHLYIHQSVIKCECGRLLFFIGTKTGKRARGLFCVVCSFKEIPFL